MKKVLPIVLIILVVLATLGGGYLLLSRSGTSTPDPASNKRQVINALPISERPFVALFPHVSNKLITLLLDKPGDIPEITVNIEYLSGNSLKGGRTSIEFPADIPFTQAFLLGSCSSGGKCSFDREITTGTIKSKIEKESEIHILKSNYVFIDGPSATTDQKLKFTPKNYTKNAILGYTHGFTGSIESEVASEPFVITSASPTTITGTLTIISADATSLLYFDGQSYQELDSTKEGSEFTATINLEPWSRDVTIIRDDQKGAIEDVTLYLLGPIIPVK